MLRERDKIEKGGLFMKKIVSLILAVMLVMACTSALAEITIYGASTNTTQYGDNLLNKWAEDFDFKIN